MRSIGKGSTPEELWHIRTRQNRLMGVPLLRPVALPARLDTPAEEWPYLDSGVLVQGLSHKVCMTCHWFRHHAGLNCIPLLTRQLTCGAWRRPRAR